ncbi:sigma-E factor negative regulatory protein [Hydrogenophaga sp.]|uniref:sigma-E factor negative regulatory protein n=1 Tax=Hydrogenophaga sp. TaxID=1904254 RepID=UPI0025BB03A9|nr:sigma-E factor negative regulatory protein [Hydrogenophaga sp.]
MNAKQNKNSTSAPVSGAGEDLDQGSTLSAMLDGELPAHELDGWLDGAASPASTATRWHAYQLIGESLRGQAPVLPAQSPAQFLAAVQLRLAQEPLATPGAPEGAAAIHHVRGQAANDAVFRWKLLAGVASLAAVMAVSWTVLGTTTGSPTNTTSPQLALIGPAAAPASPLSQVGAEPVAVNTRQGVLIRDAQLESLMAEHRQFGGVSALQMPAGFLRNATYDANGR